MQASRIRDISLERSVREVSLDEAANGASQSDSLRLASREREDGSKVPFSVYLQRAAQFRANLKDKKSQEASEPECPIEKARSESTTGENVPLNWLVADHYGGDSQPVPSQEAFIAGETHSPSKEVTEFSAQPQIASSGSLLANEWLLTPCS